MKFVSLNILQLPRKGQVIILKTKKHVKKVTENFNPPGSLLSGPQESFHPLNFLLGSHQHPEIAELRKEKSQKVCISPNPPNRKTACRSAEYGPPLKTFTEGHSEQLKSRLEPP